MGGALGVVSASDWPRQIMTSRSSALTGHRRKTKNFYIGLWVTSINREREKIWLRGLVLFLSDHTKD